MIHIEATKNGLPDHKPSKLEAFTKRINIIKIDEIVVWLIRGIKNIPNMRKKRTVFRATKWPWLHF